MYLLPAETLDGVIIDHPYGLQELLHFAVIITRNFVRVKAIERLLIASPLFQDQRPAQASLSSREDRRACERSTCFSIPQL